MELEYLKHYKIRFMNTTNLTDDNIKELLYVIRDEDVKGLLDTTDGGKITLYNCVGITGQHLVDFIDYNDYIVARVYPYTKELGRTQKGCLIGKATFTVHEELYNKESTKC
ncbi:hypothetical protein [Pasteurella phage vB_PmuP_PS07]|uniref:Uncharacterized protein n=1 Tax=Pasteurella phage vB_PmuP_PHB02 TaxID=2005054 RepID=A0A1Y0T217_9CAUD|nr:hypothetical protein HOR82_gp44 [Pasteurella phage vB_PmuP_PHB02]ARV77608.1 hypothetical protein [Pasteurella phage vB_PmuP_PHB02]UIS73866.1 hypothetical protein [Pasteurella phage vB_PmuP_PS07]UIS74016.1 hypothetical protein [Pasteurella phage vB_PmuP_PS30]